MPASRKNEYNLYIRKLTVTQIKHRKGFNLGSFRGQSRSECVHFCRKEYLSWKFAVIRQITLEKLTVTPLKHINLFLLNLGVFRGENGD